MKSYIKQRFIMLAAIRPFYQNRLFRKFKWSSYINRRKTEQRLLRNFERIFGAKENVAVVFGDFEQIKFQRNLFIWNSKSRSREKVFEPYSEKQDIPLT